jgi:hypothetical protein
VWHDARGNVIRFALRNSLRRRLAGVVLHDDYLRLADNRVNVENRGGARTEGCTADDPLESASTYDTAH